MYYYQSKCVHLHYLLLQASRWYFIPLDYLLNLIYVLLFYCSSKLQKVFCFTKYLMLKFELFFQVLLLVFVMNNNQGTYFFWQVSVSVLKLIFIVKIDGVEPSVSNTCLLHNLNRAAPCVLIFIIFYNLINSQFL